MMNLAIGSARRTANRVMTSPPRTTSRRTHRVGRLAADRWVHVGQTFVVARRRAATAACPRCSNPIQPRTLDQPAPQHDLVPFFGDMVTREYKERRDRVVADHIAEARRRNAESRPYAERIAQAAS
jgi:hypothetical protein